MSTSVFKSPSPFARTPSAFPPMLTYAQVAEYWQVCTKTVRRWVLAGDLTPVCRGRVSRFHLADVEQMFKSAQPVEGDDLAFIRQHTRRAS